MNDSAHGGDPAAGQSTAGAATVTTERADADPKGPTTNATVHPHKRPGAHAHNRRTLYIIAAVVAAAVLVTAIIPYVISALSTVSTDDAYVNGHVTFVAPRVSGQVVNVLVDDNNRVHKGDLIVQLDPEPYQVLVNIARSSVSSAQADVLAAEAQVRSIELQARSNRFKLEHAMQDVDNQVAVLHAKVAALDSQKASLVKAQDDFDRVQQLAASGAVAKEEYDHRQEALLVAKAQVEVAASEVAQIRVSLGLPAQPPDGDLSAVPANLDETFSTVRQAQADVIQSVAAIGVALIPLDDTPRKMIADFYKRDPSGNINKIYDKLLAEAPAVKQAEQRLLVAQNNLDEALLNLRYCNVYAEIDGVVTRRDVNPGNNVVVGQSLMAVRSLTEIWIDANFKETQLADIRIGQPADVYTDIYGSRVKFAGRVSGFTIGTGSTLALLPAQNATGNFVKVVQRLPVRIELTDYDPDKSPPLFIGLSVDPVVYINQTPTGPDAGKVLQPYVTEAASAAAANLPATEPATPAPLPLPDAQASASDSSTPASMAQSTPASTPDPTAPLSKPQSLSPDSIPQSFPPPTLSVSPATSPAAPGDTQ